jgi:hypothetical protein
VYIYPLVISAGGVVTKNFLNLKNTGLTKNIFKSGAKSSTTTNMSYRKKISRKHPLTLGDGVNFLPEPNPTNNLG